MGVWRISRSYGGRTTLMTNELLHACFPPEWSGTNFIGNAGNTDYTQLMHSHLHYKMALLKPGVIQALFGIILSPLAKGRKEWQDRDGQIINVVLEISCSLRTCQPTLISVQIKPSFQISNPSSRSHFPKHTPLIYFLQLPRTQIMILSSMDGILLFLKFFSFSFEV